MNPQPESDMSDTIKIKVMIRTGKVGSEDSTVIEYERCYWDEMGCESREIALFEDATAAGIMSWDWEELP